MSIFECLVYGVLFFISTLLVKIGIRMLRELSVPIKYGDTYIFSFTTFLKIHIVLTTVIMLLLGMVSSLSKVYEWLLGVL